MYLPEWIQAYKESRAEIRLINGMYYKYEVRYKYNKEKKRTDKITVRLLGKITEKEGFVPSSYRLYVRLRQAELLSKYSPKDVIEQSKVIYKMKIRGLWHRSEITQKTTRLFC